MQPIKVLNLQTKGIGRNYKNSKIQYIWKLQLDDAVYTIALQHSSFTRKYRVFINRDDEEIKWDFQQNIKKELYFFKYEAEGNILKIEWDPNHQKFKLLINEIHFREFNSQGTQSEKLQIEAQPTQKQKSLDDSDEFFLPKAYIFKTQDLQWDDVGEVLRLYQMDLNQIHY